MISELQKRLPSSSAEANHRRPELPRNAMGKVQKSLLRQTYAELYMLKRPPGMNSQAVNDVNHGHKADEGSEEHERRGGHHSWVEGFARAAFEPAITPQPT